jgi:hypothetical protein
MTSKQKLDFKKRLHQKAIELTELRVANTAAAVQHAQASANEEEKSSAGDKYETSRAMSHLEKDMYAKQLEENRKDLAMLMSVDVERIYDEALPGCIVQTDSILFFMATGLGKLDFENQMIYLLSPNAPVAKLLLHKRKGDSVIFNNKQIEIKSVF